MVAYPPGKPFPRRVFLPHTMSFGDWPVFSAGGNKVRIIFPIWLYLAVIVGWGAFREFRFRRRRDGSEVSGDKIVPDKMTGRQAGDLPAENPVNPEIP